MGNLIKSTTDLPSEMFDPKYSFRNQASYPPSEMMGPAGRPGTLQERPGAAFQENPPAASSAA